MTHQKKVFSQKNHHIPNIFGAPALDLKLFFKKSFDNLFNWILKESLGSLGSLGGKVQNYLLFHYWVHFKSKLASREFFQKNERMNSFLLLCDVFSFVFWKKLKTPKKNLPKLPDLIVGVDHAQVQHTEQLRHF